MLEGINALFLIGGLLLFVSVMATRVFCPLRVSFAVGVFGRGHVGR